jgi:DNA-binding NarL/FixJ family response regulator
MNNTVVIASKADCLAKMLSVKLGNNKVYTASNDKDLFFNINNYFPKYIFMENCFCENVTEEYVYKIKRNNENLHIIIWTASDITPYNAAFFINAGAESFISLREKDEDVNKILKQILLGVPFCPDDVAHACTSDLNNMIFDIPFSDKELKIMKLLKLRDYQIADKLQLSYATVCYHKTKVFRKLGAKNRHEVIEFCIKHKIIPSGKKYKRGKNNDY